MPSEKVLCSFLKTLFGALSYNFCKFTLSNQMKCTINREPNICKPNERF